VGVQKCPQSGIRKYTVWDTRVCVYVKMTVLKNLFKTYTWFFEERGESLLKGSKSLDFTSIK